MSKNLFLNVYNELEASVFTIARRYDIAISRQFSLAGSVIDLFIEGIDSVGKHSSLAIEIRLWDEGTWKDLEVYAKRETDFVRAAGLVKEALILVPGKPPVPTPLVTLTDLESLLKTWKPLPSKRAIEYPLPTKEIDRVAFCAMPFHEKYLDVYFLGIIPAAKELGFAVNRVDQSHSLKGIRQLISQGIADSSLVIADISGCNPNVMYEIGLAHGFGTSTFICETRLRRFRLTLMI